MDRRNGRKRIVDENFERKPRKLFELTNTKFNIGDKVRVKEPVYFEEIEDTLENVVFEIRVITAERGMCDDRIWYSGLYWYPLKNFCCNVAENSKIPLGIERGQHMLELVERKKNDSDTD